MGANIVKEDWQRKMIRISKSKILLSALFIIALISLIHTFSLLAVPNAMQGSNFFGYSRTRFVLILGSFSISALFIFASYWIKISGQRIEVFHVEPTIGLCFASIIGMAITLAFQLLNWPEIRLSTPLLAIRENFGLTLFWLIPILLIALLLSLFLSSQTLNQFVVHSIIAISVLAFVNLRLINALTFRYPGTGGDSIHYIGYSSLKYMFTHGLVWSGPRPFVLPVLGTILKQNADGFAWFQTCVSILAWIILAFSVSGMLRHPSLKVFAIIAILLFSLHDRIFVWDWSILSESFTFSLMAILIAIWILGIRNMTWGKMSLLIAVSLLWGFTRDLNSWILLLIVIPIFFVWLFKKANYRFLFIAMAYLAIFLSNSNSVNSSPTPRWLVPYMNVLAFDILPIREAREFFAENGMPLSSKLLSWASEIPDYRSYFYSREFEEFRSWVVSRGRSTLGIYLINSVPTSLVAPLNSKDGFPMEQSKAIGRTWDYETILPTPIKAVIFFDLRNPIILWIVVICVYYAIGKLITMQQSKWIVPLMGVALSYPYAFLAWHGDALERSRHILPAEVLLRASLIILFLLIGDEIVSKRRGAAPISQVDVMWSYCMHLISY
jgi:hypothetical protein